MKCPFCAEEIVEGSKKCSVCKENLSNACKFCKEEIADGAIKCKHCHSMQNVAIVPNQEVINKNGSNVLNRTTYFIREHIAFPKITNTYDIIDPETKEQLGIAMEKQGLFYQLLAFIGYKKQVPTKVFVYEGNNPNDDKRVVFSIQRGFTFLKSKVNVCDGNGIVIGRFESKSFSLGVSFYVFDSTGNKVGFLKGDWKGWNFTFFDNSQNEIGSITKKWAGIGKELFTTADNYIISLNEKTMSTNASILLLAAGLAIDIVFKE